MGCGGWAAKQAAQPARSPPLRRVQVRQRSEGAVCRGHTHPPGRAMAGNRGQETVAVCGSSARDADSIRISTDAYPSGASGPHPGSSRPLGSPGGAGLVGRALCSGPRTLTKGVGAWLAGGSVALQPSRALLPGSSTPGSPKEAATKRPTGLAEQQEDE